MHLCRWDCGVSLMRSSTQSARGWLRISGFYKSTNTETSALVIIVCNDAKKVQYKQGGVRERSEKSSMEQKGE